ncbi:hypothetical protein Pla22_28010 [Rubripirellula amarantea]|uniref:Uncharacterized protein n=1 Tax=Rubripirellula amarantea TaxID=2527999 RepID=A0A5C5WWQ7_9BACT|nr:hypothetical protein Pla22_28010 [Rubripirellula amarantea]
MPKLKLPTVALVAIGILSLPCLYVFFTLRSLSSFPYAYASDWTVVFITDHVRTSGKWPTGWGDLEDEYHRMAPASHYALTFDELKKRVWLDWNVDLDTVRDADPPKRIFRLTSGRRVSFNGDPNELIRDFLRTGEAPWMESLPIGGTRAGNQRVHQRMRSE